MADDLKTLFDKLQEIKEKELKFEKDRADETFKEKVKEDKALKKLNAESRKITADSLRALRDTKKQEKVIQERIDELQKTRDTDKEKYDKIYCYDVVTHIRRETLLVPVVHVR